MIRRKQIKRIAGCVMAVTMALTGVPVTAGTENINVEVVYADEILTYTEGNSSYTYKELSDGTLEISDYEGTDTEIVIPGEIDGKKVTSIGFFAFSECISLTSIEIPESVTSIIDFAFSDCSSLTSIEIPLGVTSIGDNAFWGCSSLEEIEVDTDNSKYKSAEGVLFDKELTKIICYPLGKKDTVYIVPEGVTSIGYRAFSGYSSLEKIVIPEGVTSIGSSAFADCSSLTSVEIPESVTSINDFAFSGCSSLTSIEIPEEVTSIGYCAFYDCSSLTNIEILEGVTFIDPYAFAGCSNLTIYGKKDSYAETYANVYDISFIAIDEITSSDNITVIYPVDSVQGIVSLQTKKLTQEDEEYKNIVLEDKIIDSLVAVEDVDFTAYDISLVDENNNKVQPSQVVTVKILCPEGYDGEKCNIYRVNDDGTFTDMKAEYERGYLVFKTNHFSVYLITETELLTTPDIISGDVNGDGTLDIKDSALLKRYLAGWEVEIDEEAADVDGDGKVTIKDSALVKRYLAGWDVEFTE